MNRKMKLFAAVCGLSLACLVSAKKSTAGNENTITVSTYSCIGNDSRTCFVEKGREVRGYWVEKKVVITTAPTNQGDPQ